MAEDLKSAIDDLGKAVHDMQELNDERFEQIKNGKNVDPLLEEQVTKANERLGELDEIKNRLDLAETTLARKNKIVTEKESELETKAQNFEALCAKTRGMNPQGNFTAENMADYEKGLNSYLRKGEAGMTMDQQKALSVGSDPDGGFLVDPDTSGRMVSKIFETSAMRSVASVQTIGTDALEGTYDLDEASAGWVGETDARAETDTPKISKWRIPVHELYAKPTATQKLLDDSSTNVEAWLAGKVGDKMGRIENNAFILGDGVGKPRGILTYPDGTTLPSTIQRTNSGASGTFVADPNGGDVFINTAHTMKSALRAGARWAMNRSTLASVRLLKDGDGNYLWQAGLQAGQPSSLIGYSVLEFEDMPDLGAGSLSIAFANFGDAYQIVDRQGIRVLRDPYSNKPFIEFYTVKRTGGDVINFDAIKLIEFSA